MSYNKSAMTLAIILVLFALANSELVCLEDEEELFHIGVGNPNNRNEIHRRRVIFQKRQIVKEMEIVVRRITKESLYCPAILNVVTTEECSRKSKPFFPDDTVNKQSLLKNQCPIGKICKDDDCDGLTKEECENVSLMGWMDPNTNVNLKPSLSMLHHRCVTGYTCRLLKIKVRFLFINPTKVNIEGDLFGDCEMDIDSTYCQTDDGWTLHLHKKLEMKTEMVDLPCLKGQDGELCWDSVENEDFLLEGKEAFMANTIYTVDGEMILAHPMEPHFHNSPANLQDLESIYRILQYENLQTNYNVLLLQKKIEEIQRLLIDIIKVSYGIFNDPLEGRRGMPGKIKQYNGTHFTLVGCKERKNVTISKILGTNIISSSVLFPNFSLIVEEFKRKDFRIQLYDIESLERMIKRTTKGNEGTSGGSFDSWGTLLGGIKNFFIGIQSTVWWFCSFLSIVNLKILITKARL